MWKNLEFIRENGLAVVSRSFGVPFSLFAIQEVSYMHNSAPPLQSGSHPVKQIAEISSPSNKTFYFLSVYPVSPSTIKILKLEHPL